MNSKNRWQQVLRGGVAVLSLALLASCGGGKREAFHPGHMYVFGDEFSYVDIQYTASATDGVRYTVNHLKAVGGQTAQPLIFPSWTQYLASHYDKAEQPCAATESDAMSMCAGAGANTTVADTVAAIDTKSFQKDELVVIMAGTRDILNAYQSFKAGGSIDTLATTVKNAGIQLGQKINAITTTGARVAVATIPDIGLSAYASAEAGGVANLRNYSQAMDCDTAYRPGTGEYSKALSYLTACFNYGLRGTNGIVNDGKKIALITTFDWSVLVARNPTGYLGTYANAFDPACTTPAHNSSAIFSVSDAVTCNYYYHCSTGTTTTSAATYGTTSYMWAFGPWLAPAGQAMLGSRAVNQVNLNWGE